MSRKRRLGLLGCGCLLLLGGCCGLPALVAVGIPAGFRGAAALREVDSAAEVAPGERIDVDGQAIHVQRWNPGGPRGPLVLVPGTSAWADTWVEIAVPLAEAGFDVVALDLPPFGFSERPADGDYTRTAQATRINGLIDALGFEELALMGHSFGGGATVEAAMQRPERIRHLLLLDVALGLGQPAASGTVLLRQPLIAEPLVAMTMTNPGFTPTGVSVMVASPDAVTAAQVDRYRRPLTVTGSTSAVAAWLPELLDPTPSRSSDPANYRTLQVHTTLLWGELDTATPLAQAEALHGLLPDSELVVLPGLGHLPQIEGPAAVVQAVLDASDPAGFPGSAPVAE